MAVKNVGKGSKAPLKGIQDNPAVPSNHHVKGLVDGSGRIHGRPNIPEIREAREAGWAEKTSGVSAEEKKVLDEAYKRYTDPDINVGPKDINRVRFEMEPKLDKDKKPTLDAEGKPVMKRKLDKDGNPIISRAVIRC